MLQLQRRVAQGERVLGVIEMPRVLGCGQAGEPPLRRKSLRPPSHQKDEKNEGAGSRRTGRALACNRRGSNPKNRCPGYSRANASQECGLEEIMETAE